MRTKLGSRISGGLVILCVLLCIVALIYKYSNRLENAPIYSEEALNASLFEFTTIDPFGDDSAIVYDISSAINVPTYWGPKILVTWHACKLLNKSGFLRHHGGPAHRITSVLIMDSTNDWALIESEMPDSLMGHPMKLSRRPLIKGETLFILSRTPSGAATSMKITVTQIKIGEKNIILPKVGEVIYFQPAVGNSGDPIVDKTGAAVALVLAYSTDTITGDTRGAAKTMEHISEVQLGNCLKFNEGAIVQAQREIATSWSEACDEGKKDWEQGKKDWEQGEKDKAKRNFHRAISYYHRALDYDSLCADAYFMLGVCHASLEEWRPSIQSYSKYIELDRNNWQAHLNLGFAYLGNRDYYNVWMEIIILQSLDPELAKKLRQAAGKFSRSMTP